MPTLYRVCRRNPPLDRELMSHGAQGRRLPKDASPESVESWDRVSTLTTRGLATEIARQAGLGNWIVTLEVPDAVRLKEGRRRQLGRHVDLIDTTPEQLRSYISGIDPIQLPASGQSQNCYVRALGQGEQ